MPGYTRLGKILTAELYASLLDALELGNIHQGGRGILSGLEISAGTGLTLNIAAGVLRGLKEVTINATAAAMPAASTVYVWIDEEATVTTSPTLADPGGTFVCLGKVVSGGSSISSVSTEGRMALLRMPDLHSLIVGNEALFVDLLNSRVGIGRDDPQFRLDIRADDEGKAAVDALLMTERLSGIPVAIDETWQLYTRGGTLEARAPQDAGGAVFQLLHPSSGLPASDSPVWKQPVRAVSVNPATLSSSFENGDTIDGVTLATGDRILIAGQFVSSENGIYVVNATGAPTRAEDADENGELVGGSCVYVREGTLYGGTVFACTNTGAITIGTTGITFAEVAGRVSFSPAAYRVPRANANSQLADGWVPPQRLLCVTGRWYDANALGTIPGHLATSSVSGDRLYAAPFFWPAIKSIDRIAFEVTAAVASSNARAGIYEMAASGFPGALVVDGGEISTATTGVKEATVTVSNLKPGWYYFAFLASAAITVRINSNGNIGFSVGRPNSTTTDVTQGWYHNVSYGGLPATFPTGSIVETWFVPRVSVRAA